MAQSQERVDENEVSKLTRYSLSPIPIEGLVHQASTLTLQLPFYPPKLLQSSLILHLFEDRLRSRYLLTI